MATLARHLVTVEEFLEFAFDTDEPYELDNGVVRLMAGGQAIHARIQRNVLVALTQKLAGSGCAPFGSDMGVRTHQLSLRYPDASVFCGREGPENDRVQAFDDPLLIIEVLSPSTRTRDIEVKLPEYRAVPSLKAILYIDPDNDTLHLETRDPQQRWIVTTSSPDSRDSLAMLGITLTREEIFARQ